MYPSFNARAVGLRLSTAATLDLAVRAGFPGVDLLVRDLLDDGDDPRRVRARMDDLGLRGGAFPMPVHWRGDAETFARDLARLPRLAEAAALLGLARTSTWVLAETPGRPESAPDRAAHHAAIVAMHVDRLGAIARLLDRFGIRLGLEVIGVASSRTGRGLPFVTRMADLDPVLGTLWGVAPNLGIVIDAWHLYAAGEPIEAGLAWGIRRVVWVHVADLPAASPNGDRTAMIDQDRGLPGEHGAIANRALLQRLKEAGYDGPVTAEPMAGCRTLVGLGPEAVAQQVAAALDSIWPEGGSRT